MGSGHRSRLQWPCPIEVSSRIICHAIALKEPRMRSILKQISPARWTLRMLAPLALALIWSTSLAAAADKGLTPGKPSDVGMEAGPLAEIAQRMQEFVEQRQVAGVVTLVARQGRIVHLEAVGQADIDNKLPMRKDTIFGIASMTKPMT